MRQAAIGIGAIVLAGGRSRRMGHDKATLLLAPSAAGWPAELLAARVCRAVTAACDPVYLVGAPGQELPELPHVRVVHDAAAHEGPLAGVATGLDAFAPDAPGRVLVVGVDAARITPELIRALALRGTAAVAVSEGEGIVPLPSIVPVAAARRATHQLLARGERRLRALVEALAPLRVTREELLADPELRAVDPDLRGLEDADDPSSLSRLLR